MSSGTDRIDAVLALFKREGYARAEPPVLQPAEPFLDLSGEDIRRRLFLTQGADDAELCLRPEFTIPICRHHIASGATVPANYSYAGPVFRQRAGEAAEFPQAGIESIGRSDAAATDAEVLALALEALSALGAADLPVTLGDMGLLDALIDALGLDAATKRRVVRAVATGQGAENSLAALDTNGHGASDHAGLLAALEGQDPNAARAFVEDVLSISGISTVGGRSAAEIADRFLSRASRAGMAVPAEARDVLRRYLALAGDPDTVAADLRALSQDAKLGLDAALDAFEERTGFMAARGLDPARLAFSAAFARNLDYYTGFIFEVRGAHGKPLAGGGRYDGLIARLGAPAPVPAVGCAIWLDRVAGEARR